jgi:UDP-N-acetylmuramyl tripeptide synthase
LDRYGEVEHVAAIWREVVQELPETVTLVLNADDPAVASLAGAAKGRVLFYGLEDAVVGVQGLDHAADARWCSSCGSELSYAVVFFGHLGRWRCPDCGAARPAVAVACLPSESGTDGQDLTLRLPEGEMSARLPLTGLYNAYNALAAAAVATVLGVEAEAIEKGLRFFTAGFGRQERLKVGGRQLQVILAKNPAGLNQVLRAITADGAQKDLLLFLNDNIADGQDVSWIWDVDFELLAGATRSLSVSGTRAWDMALRLKYAGLDPLLRVEPDTAKALRMALRETPEEATLYVIPTYTALLELRRLLARMGERAALWQED